MKLINYPSKINMEIEFKLNIDKKLFKTGEDYCMFIDIIVNLKGEMRYYENIKIDITSINNLVNHLNSYLNKDICEIDYLPSEECFWLFEKKGKLSEEDITDLINEMKELGLNKETIEELENRPYTITLVLQIDKEYSQKHGCGSHTGEAYIINVTKEDLRNFTEELENEVERLTLNDKEHLE